MPSDRCHYLEIIIDNSFINFPPFHFLVGPASKIFYIHSGLAERLSMTRGTLVGGDMIEPQQGSARSNDIDENTFPRFTEFAYTGGYRNPESHIILSVVYYPSQISF